MASFKQMQKEGVIKRADASKILYEDIHIEPGFNLGNRHEDNDDIDQELYEHIKSGGYIPDLEVRPRADGGVWIVDGHRRFTQIGRCDRDGVPLRDKSGALWISIKQFDGNDIHRVARMLTSNRKKDLTPVQVAEGYFVLERLGQSPQEIAAIVHKTRQHVDQMLILAKAPSAIQNAVKAGEISATDAIKLARNSGEVATDVLEQQREKAKAAGAKKITGSVVKAWTPPATMALSMADTLDVFIGLLPFNAKQRLAEIEAATARGELPDGQMVSVPVDALLLLINEQSSVSDARKAADEKSAQKAAKASQKEWPFSTTAMEGA